MNTVNLRFGYGNAIESADLASDPASTTPISYLPDIWKARLAVWTAPNADGNVVITGTLPTATSEFIALVGANLIGDAEINLELYKSPDDNLDILNMSGFDPILKDDPEDVLPLGIWSASTNPYKEPNTGPRSLLPDTYVYWFGRPVEYDSFKLTIRAAALATEPLGAVRLRSLIMGNMIELKNNFTFPHGISFLTDTNLKRTSGGSYVSIKAQKRSRMITLPVPMSDDQDLKNLWRLETTLDNKPFIVSAFPSSEYSYYQNYNMLAHFKNTLSHSTAFFELNGATLELVEA